MTENDAMTWQEAEAFRNRKFRSKNDIGNVPAGTVGRVASVTPAFYGGIQFKIKWELPEGVRHIGWDVFSKPELDRNFEEV